MKFVYKPVPHAALESVINPYGAKPIVNMCYLCIYFDTCSRKPAEAARNCPKRAIFRQFEGQTV